MFIRAILCEFSNCSKLYKCASWGNTLSRTMGGLGTGMVGAFPYGQKTRSLTHVNQAPRSKWVHQEATYVYTILSLP